MLRDRRVRLLAAFLFFSATPFLLVDTASAADWPSWRGPNDDGVSPETGLPSHWSAEGESLAWSVPIGGRSTPVVLDGRVCAVTLAEPATPQKWQERIFCLDENNGKLLWEYRRNIYQTDIPHHRVGWASVVADPQTGYLYSQGPEGMLLCLDRAGKLVWSRSMEEEVGRISGFGGRTVTPMLDGDLMIVSFLNAAWGENFVPRHRYYALDKRTGETVWISTPGGPPLDTIYSVPVVAVINGERLLIDGNADGGIYALKVGTGEKVWGVPLSKRGINSSVVVDGNVVYASHSEDNVDGSTTMGRVVALDAGQVVDGKPKEVWRAEGFAAGYASPSIQEGILYHIDNSANLAAFDAKTGEQLWSYSLGIAQRSSPVVADGKIYVSDVDGKFYILKLQGRKAPERLDMDEFHDPDGAASQINGSPAVANGRVFFFTTQNLYALGGKQKKSGAEAKRRLPPAEKAPPGAMPASVQVVPAEINLHPGAKHKFVARTFDAQGRLIAAVDAQWSLENLKGAIGPSGELTVSEQNIPQGGRLVATVGNLKGYGRVSSRPNVPYMEDFESTEEKKVPAGWTAAQGRFQVVSQEGNKVLRKPSEDPRTWRTTVYIGDPDATGYLVEGEMMASEVKRRLPDIGLVSHRYTMALMGNRQELAFRTWFSELDRFSKVLKYKWDPSIWYQMKFLVEPAPDGSVTRLFGKVWKKGEAEPREWTIEAVDNLPHTHGSPGIYGYSAADIYFDNVKITPASR